MSVLINGMKTPDRCGHCRFANAFDCTVTGSFISTHSIRQPDCPLVPVPPHGDLIDENDVRKLLTEMISLSNSIVNGTAIIEWVADNITQCQTIIPAEEGE